MNKIDFLTMKDCSSCKKAKEIFDEVMPDFPDVEVKMIDITTDEGQKLVQQFGIMASPGIVIDGELFSTGGVNKDELVTKLKTLK